MGFQVEKFCHLIWRYKLHNVKPDLQLFWMVFILTNEWYLFLKMNGSKCNCIMLSKAGFEHLIIVAGLCLKNKIFDGVS